MLHLSDCRNIAMVHIYVLFCEFFSLHSLGTPIVFCFLFITEHCHIKNNVFPLLFDTVLYCLTYQVLSCMNFVVTVTETDGQ